MFSALDRPRRVARSRVASRRAIARATRPRRRLGRLIADGLTPAQAARVEGIGEAELVGLLAEPGFARLVEAYRAFDALPEEARRERLVRLARCVIEDAVEDGDVRVAAFVLREEGRGRDPARTIADGVIAAHRRATDARSARPARPPAAIAAAPARASRPHAEPGDRAAWRTAARLRDAVAAEHAARHGAAASTDDTDVAVGRAARSAATSPAPERTLNRRERRRQAALTRCHTTEVGPVAPTVDRRLRTSGYG